ncbi:glycosyltransferase [uncultured Muriicola sp.]|uniref:glycosyltransferase n=1 Tax=uncultured Muriicola sp. TaxID=1583102 RepID=UPI00260DE4B1|nr:glycosyltransferase [uncultured Muriicola sp.]
MDLFFSFIIPVYNRPDEIRELLDSLLEQTYQNPYEVVIVEDGSQNRSEEVARSFQKKLQISYYFKENSGPGDSRNYGMRKAKGNYFIILDSDCLLPPTYLDSASKALVDHYVDCFGGPDTAHHTFSTTQKAINYAMTAFISTGGIRGNKKVAQQFQPRSFNMGISKEAFEKTGGFGKIHPGEDPDLSIRLWGLGFNTRLIPEAFVYHKRRVDFNKFYTQVKKFGMVRPILNSWHPKTAKLTYWFPIFFIIGLIVSIFLAIVQIPWFLFFYLLYFVVVLIDSWYKNKKLGIALLSLWAVIIQFTGYGLGFFKSTFLLTFSKKKPQELFPFLFFK